MTPEELDDLIGRNVRAVRSGKRLRQEDLADEIGWDRAIITRIEAGRRRLTFSDIIALCGALDIELRQLLAGVATRRYWRTWCLTTAPPGTVTSRRSSTVHLPKPSNPPGGGGPGHPMSKCPGPPVV